MVVFWLVCACLNLKARLGQSYDLTNEQYIYSIKHMHGRIRRHWALRLAHADLTWQDVSTLSGQSTHFRQISLLITIKYVIVWKKYGEVPKHLLPTLCQNFYSGPTSPAHLAWHPSPNCLGAQKIFWWCKWASISWNLWSLYSVVMSSTWWFFCNKFIFFIRIFPDNSQNKILTPWFGFQGLSLSLSKASAPNNASKQASFSFVFLSIFCFCCLFSYNVIPWCLNLFDKKRRSDYHFHFWCSNIDNIYVHTHIQYINHIKYLMT